MKRLFLAAVVITAFYNCRAQTGDADVWKEASKESQAYHEYRLETSEPPYSLEKIKALISKIKLVDNYNGDGGTEALDQKTYLSLSLRERFTYHMINAESYSQNCDAMPPIQDEQKKIFGQLPDAFGEYNWSERQTKFFLANRDSVVAFMKECISKDKRIGLNYKNAIVDINAKELIPFLMSIYNLEKKDHDILTVLMLLMRDNEYPEFLVSSSYKKLYGDKDANYQACLNFNVENEALIIQRATNFYNGLGK